MSEGRLRYLEDFAPGQEFDLGTAAFDRDGIVAFATLYDPQPFHLTDKGGVESPFGRLVASGWQTAMTMVQMWLDHLVPRGGRMISTGVEAEWHRPVAPGDELSVRARIGDVTVSTSNPARGWIHVEVEAFSVTGELVAVVRTRSLLDRAPE